MDSGYVAQIGHKHIGSIFQPQPLKWLDVDHCSQEDIDILNNIFQLTKVLPLAQK
jgi:hypothetical protein